MLTVDEIRNIYAQMPSWKALRSDEFQIWFYKFSWVIVEDDIVNLVQDFFRTQSFNPSLNFTYQTLIQKV